MFGISFLTRRRLLILLHDVAMTGGAVVVSVYLLGKTRFHDRIPELGLMLPGIMIYAGLVFYHLRLFDTLRLASVLDCYRILQAAAVMALSLLALDYVLVSPQLYGTYFFGKVTIFHFWWLQLLF